jgi:hypothetical protein
MQAANPPHARATTPPALDPERKSRADHSIWDGTGGDVTSPDKACMWALRLVVVVVVVVRRGGCRVDAGGGTETLGVGWVVVRRVVEDRWAGG